MNFKMLTIGCIATLSSISLFAQEPIKWGKIPDEDLKMTTYPLDTSAAALVLADLGDLSYDLKSPGQQTDLFVHRRIKIFKRTGFEEGNIEIPYYSKDRYQDLLQLKAQIFNPDGTKRSIEKKDFFEEKTGEGWTTAKFTFPEIKEGSIIEYTYSIRTKDWVNLSDWYFQEAIPVRLSEYTLHIPEFLEFVILTRGRPLDRNEQTMENNPIASSSNIRLRKYVLAMENAPGLKRESFITTMRDYLGHASFQLSGIVENGLRKPHLSDWSTVAKELMDTESFGKRIDRRANYNDVYDKVAPLVAAATLPEDKIKAIYHFILDNYKWDGTYGKYVNESLNKSFELKKGDVAALNLTLVALLKAFGFDAKPLLVSTRGHGKPIELYPILDQFNCVLAHVKVDDKTYLLDATDPNRPMGLPAVNALNGKGWLVDPLHPEWIDITPSKATTIRMYNIELNEEGKASGKLVSSYEGYTALEIREELTKKTETGAEVDESEENDEEVSATVASIEYDSVAIKNLDNIYKPLSYNAKITIPEGGTVNGDFIYFNPVVHPAFDENPFKQTIREYPVDLAYPLSHRYILNLYYPEGYTIEQMPQQAILVLPNNGGKFTFLVNKSAGVKNMLQINCSILLNQVYFEPEEYSTIKKFFDLIIEKQQEQVVLKKL